MQVLLQYLAEIGPSGATVLLIAGLMYGVFGWRIIEYLVIADALLIGLAANAALGFFVGIGWSLTTPGGPLVLILPIVLTWLAWRYNKAAIVCMSGAVGFLVAQFFMADSHAPASVRILVGIVGCGLAMGLQATLFQQSAIVVTGLHGGFLCVAALTALAFYVRGYGSGLLAPLAYYPGLFLVVGTVFSAILIALQLADLEREKEPH